MQTHRDKELSEIHLESISFGTKPLFLLEEKALFIKNLKAIASLAYGKTGTDMTFTTPLISTKEKKGNKSYCKVILFSEISLFKSRHCFTTCINKGIN